MRANLPQREPEVLRRWEEIDLYTRLIEARSTRPKFILHDGPPYANGAIHIGHAVNKVLKDIIVKSRLLDGYNVPYVPGWDCHGLPIELMVEKKMGKAGKDVDPAAFRAACRAFVTQQVDQQREDFKRLGVIGDWKQPYLTMDFRCEADILRALGRIIANGCFTRGTKPVHWCTECRSALAEAEVEYQERSSPAIDVRFPAIDAADVLKRCQPGARLKGGEGAISVVIWTTTPWTLPANQAVALHPDMDYLLVQCEVGSGPERLLLGEALLGEAMARYGAEAHRVVARCRGRDLEYAKLAHPFYHRSVPVILGEHITTEAGTGAVHTAPAHGQEDFELGYRYGLPVENPIGDDGRFVQGTEFFAGKHVQAANADVIKVLRVNGNLVHETTLRHSYPHCWRHKTPIIFRVTPQWFISMDRTNLRDASLAAIKRVSWTPKWGQARIEGMVADRPDWCISRQRNWGVPIALFVHKRTSEPHPDSVRLIEEIALRVERDGVEAWFDLDPEEFLGEETSQYEKLKDILDVWFDSGVTHFCVLDRRSELGFPADLYLEGSDQHRGWFQSSLLASVAMRGTAPYKGVLTHGFTVDLEGQKMSKSKGNVLAPQKIVSTLGADVLRLWVAASDYRGEITVSDEILKRIADSYRRMRNTARFLLANLHDFNPATDRVPREHMLALDRWAMDRAYQLQRLLIDAYLSYDFHPIYQRVHNFCTVDMGSFYLDIIKDRQYTMRVDSRACRSAQTAIYHIIEALVRWLAPILSFTTEEIWSHVPGSRDESVFFSTWYGELQPLAEGDPFNRRFWDRVIALREGVGKELEKLRVAGKIGSFLDAEVDLYCDEAWLKELARLEDELRFVLITSYARVHPAQERPGDTVGLSLDAGGEVWIEVTPSAHAKCVRCWHHRADVGGAAHHPTLCGRCVENIEGAGEKRLYA
jgi:isoleucyl-tRNA synthetase